MVEVGNGQTAMGAKKVRGRLAPTPNY